MVKLSLPANPDSRFTLQVMASTSIRANEGSSQPDQDTLSFIPTAQPLYPLAMGPSSTEKSNDATENVLISEPPYSIFSHWEKRWIGSVASFGAMFSTLSSYIYFPALAPMASDLGVSLTLINLTVTSYLIVAGIAPAFMGDLADQGGRRPAYILMFALALGSNIGLALQNSYPLLLVLRMVQSAGISASYGAAYGILADITTVSERGSYVGIMLVFTGAAPSFGPVVAGAFSQTLGWRWIFWFLAILTGAYFVIVVLLLPETQRNVVGNGSVKAQGLYRSVFDYFIRDRVAENDNELLVKRKHRFPNPFNCVVMLFDKGNFAVILAGSITYAVKMTLQASLAAQVMEIYGLNHLETGLTYLPSAIGGAMASYVTGRCFPTRLLACAEFHVVGKLLDKNVKKMAAQLGRDGVYRRGDDILDFPIERARLTGLYSLVSLSSTSTIGYGISLMTRSHLAVPLIMQFISGGATSSIFTICGTLLTDMNPNASATVQASYNILRCVGAGVSIAAQQPLADAVGLGWCFGVFGIIMMMAAPLGWILKRYGMAWRNCSARPE
ncbi:hypothetical protein S7711_02745 [Stachybotrys chartarum IBT 7711]|uniref:Major facilitator superfamily (MFS) profile domain-containing protein n=1 Tax=Stachybotrys chartarum (strain CBS 109288 / IBT 7711) TaxID=1280523 RepID=A0A084ALV1_STACB|nr:hypothetical protein S7711_02745 [Stachybotrys chartarum IBT 7711]